MHDFWRRHSVALIFAFVVGVIAMAPTLLAPLTLDGAYQGVQFAALDDEDLYRGMIHDVLDGHWLAASPFLYEYKDSSTVVIPRFNTWLYALIALFFGLSGAIILSKFLLPALLFFLIYLLVRQLLEEGGNRYDIVLTALAAGLFATAGYDLINYQYLIPALKGAGPVQPMVWTRLVNPIVGTVIAFGFFALLQKILVDRSKRAIMPAGALLALTICYYFSFGISMAVLGVLMLIALARKEFVTFRNLLYTLGISLAIDAWYWWGIISTLQGDPGEAARNGMYFTHAPVVNKLLLLATFVVLASFLFSYVWKKHRETTRQWIFIAALIGGSWIAYNQQILTGREVWYYHFVQYTIPLSAIAVLAASFLAWRPFAPRLWRIAIYTLCAASLAYGLFSITSYRSHTDTFARQQTFASLFSWISKNAPHDCVILIKENNQELERLIPAYTQCNGYSTVDTYTGVPRERILHNYLLRLRLNGVTASDIDAYLLSHENDVRIYFFDNWDQLYGHGQDAWFFAKAKYLAEQYRDFYAKNLKNELFKYRLDYLISRDPLPAAIRSMLPGLEKKATVGEFTVYSFY